MDFDIEKLNCMIDLHLHLDGSISVNSAKELANLQGIAIPKDDEEIEKLLIAGPDCKDLNSFLEKFEFPCSLLQTALGLETAAYNLVKELAGDGLMYGEIRFAPQKSCDKGLTQRQAVEAVLKGLNRAKDILKTNLILCCMRGSNLLEENLETVRIAKELMDSNDASKVVAVDLAGAEALFPTEDYRDVFQFARILNVPFTIHAGEAAGPDSVRKALDFGAVRLGHGVRALEDPELIMELAQRQIPLECCPTSNLNTCIYSDISEYPLRRLMEAGVAITINTDDMSVCGTNLQEEFRKLIDTFDLSKEEIKGLLLNSVNAAFISEEEKDNLREKLCHEFESKMK